MSDGISFSFFQRKVTGLKSLMKSKPISSSCISSFNLISEGAVIEVAPAAILESVVEIPKVKLLSPTQLTSAPKAICPLASPELTSAESPIRTLFPPVVKFTPCEPASTPITILLLPVVILSPAFVPILIL